MALQHDVEYVSHILKQGGNGGIKFVSVPKEVGGYVLLRFPPLCQQTVKQRWQHWYKGKPITCLKTFGEKCPICQLLFDSNVDVDKKKNYFQKETKLIQCIKVKEVVASTGKRFEVEDFPIMLNSNNSTIEYLMQLSGDLDVFSIHSGIVIKFIRNSNNKIDKVPLSQLDISKIIDEFEEKLIDWEEFITKPSQEDIDEFMDKLKEKLSSLESGSGSQQQNQQGSQHQTPDCFGQYNPDSDKCKRCHLLITCSEAKESVNKTGVEDLDEVPF